MKQHNNIIFTGHIGYHKVFHKQSLDNFIEKNRKILICEHDEYCNVKKFLDKTHCSIDYTKTCQTAKYYKKYQLKILQEDYSF